MYLTINISHDGTEGKFSQTGIHTEFVGELQQDLDAMKDVRDGQIQLLFISPESLLWNSHGGRCSLVESTKRSW